MDRLLQPLVELKQQLETVIRLAGCVNDRDMKPTTNQRNRIIKLTDFQLGMCKLIEIVSRRLQNAFASTASPTPVESALLDKTNSMGQLFRQMLPLASRSESYEYLELEKNPVVNIKCFVATLSELETEMIATYNRVADEEKAIERRKKNQVKKAKKMEKKRNSTPQQKEESVEAEIKTESNDLHT